MDRQLSLLIVDDDPLILRLLSLMMSIDGFTIHTSTSGAEAMLLLKDQQVDILLTDYSMPKMNGMELIRETRKTHPNLIIYMMTAYSTEFVSRYGSEEGIQKVLTKPLNLDALRSLLSSTNDSTRLA